MLGAEQYEIVIGLEVHAQLLTRTKLFCGDTTSFGSPPNTQVSAISLGHPGTLPKLNKEAITLAVRLGLACRCQIVQANYFARKNYFYPDLPKGYQISQHTTPICRNGFVEINAGGNTRQIRLNRIHIEEDAGKSLHDDETPFSNLDFNRAGMPLLEIVSEPDLRSAAEAAAFVTQLRSLVRHLGVCDGNMEEGSLRCDVNISVRKKGDEKLGTKVEIKNLNSIRFIKKAIEYESARLIGLHQKGETILQQTRGFRETDGSTYAIRTKEDEDDYRYFPEPDLPPFYVSDETIEAIRASMPPLKEETRKRFVTEFGLSDYDASQLSNEPDLSELFFEMAAMGLNQKAVANWILGPVKTYLSANEFSLEETGIRAAPLALLIQLVEEEKINYGTASQRIFPELVKDPALDITTYIETNELYLQKDEGTIDSFIDVALSKHSQKIGEYQKGKKGLISLFVGEVMKLSKGKADAKLVTEKIIEKLKN